MTPRLQRTFAIAVLSLVTLVAGADGDDAATPARPRTKTVVAGPRYRAGSLHRFLMGSGYRDLWTTPIEVEVLDLRGFSGGLKPEKKGGGKQTRALKFEAKDGREWKFRSIDKDPSAVLPEGLRDTFVDTMAQDQISASHPGNAPVVDALSDAAGILHVPRRLVVLPDDPALGDYRQEFAGMLGTLEEDVRVMPPVTPGFEGFRKLLDTEELTELLDSDPHARIDARAFLKARLFDFLIGDYDRHQNQWDWARSEATGLFVPVPKDRDLAFVDFDGLVLDLVRSSQPRLVSFEDSYPSIVGLMWQARFLDRRHHAELPWAAWPEVVSDLQSGLPDQAIDDAVRRMPEPYYRLSGDTLAARLKARRDRLPQAARRYYELLAREAEVHATNQGDRVVTMRAPDGSLEVQLGAGSESDPYFERRFQPKETAEVRVFLKDGDDRAVSRGDGPPEITVRVVGGGGNDVLDDSAVGHTRFYDEKGENDVIPGPGTKTDDRPYTPPVDANGNPERDWGTATGVFPWVRAGDELGVLVGGELKRTQYGFRKHPYSHRHGLRLGYSTRLSSARAEYEYDSLRIDGKSRFYVLARATALELLHFHGFGNETEVPEPESFYDVKQPQYSLFPSYRFDLTSVDVTVGPVVKYATTRLGTPSLIAEQRPYGVGDFGQVGARARIVLDRRDHPRFPRHGAFVTTEGTFYPKAWSVDDHFGEVHGEAAFYATGAIPVLEPTLALRVGGKKVFGRYPFFEAAYVGGPETVRGLFRQRYAGDASLYGNAELRFEVLEFRGALPSRIGLLGLVDTGRVYLEGESSRRWHTAVGGGLWMSVIGPENTVSLSVAWSEGRVGVYVQGGFIF
jgi:hypothetical protein